MKSNCKFHMTEPRVLQTKWTAVSRRHMMAVSSNEITRSNALAKLQHIISNRQC